jgi:glycosyltransferase involved in cell wall biosynthesis
MDQNPKLNVMHVILNLERAGAQAVVHTLAEYQRAQGCKVIVCALRDGPLRPEIERTGIQVEILPALHRARRLWPKTLLKMRQVRDELVTLVNRYKVDVLQTHLLEGLDFVIPTLRWNTDLRGALWTVHNVDFLSVSSRPWLTTVKRLLHRWWYRLTVSQVNGFVAVSDQVREAIIEEIGPIYSNVFTIPNGVDIRRFEVPGDRAALCNDLGLSPDAYLFVTVGRLTEQKGHRYLIEAARDVVVAHPCAHFLFIGDGELRVALANQAAEADIASHVHFLGVQSDVPSLLAAVDAFVLPSLWEGLSVALLEAMAAGKPIIATAVSGTIDVLQDGTTGRVIPPGDSRALTTAMTQFLDDSDAARKLGHAAKSYVAAHYSAQVQAERYLALYRELIARQ